MTALWSPWTVRHTDFPSQISAVNAGHAPTDDTVPSGDKSTVPHPHEPACKTVSAGNFKRVIPASVLLELTDGDTDAGGLSRSANPNSLLPKAPAAADTPVTKPLHVTGGHHCHGCLSQHTALAAEQAREAK